AAVRLLHRGVEHHLRGAPDVAAGAVALDEGDDGAVGDAELAVLEADLLSGGRCHGQVASSKWAARYQVWPGGRNGSGGGRKAVLTSAVSRALPPASGMSDSNKRKYPRVEG